MKIWKILTAAVLMAGALSASDAPKVDMKSNMHKLNESLNKVQSSFMTGDMKGAAGFVVELNTINRSLFVNSESIKNMMPAGKEHLSGVAMNQSKKMDEASNKMLEAVNAKNYSQAQSEFVAVMRACMNCHNIVRDWGKEIK
jgi:hypothetical protein